MSLKAFLFSFIVSFVFASTFADEDRLPRLQGLVHPTIPILFRMYKIGLFSKEKLCQFVDEIKIQWVGQMKVERMPLFRLETLTGIAYYEYKNNLDCSLINSKEIPSNE
jgi:hypothetical protein